MSSTCDNCHQIIPATVRYCAYCGHPLTQQQPQPFVTRRGDRIETLADVVPTLRRNGRAWRDGLYHLYNGHFETWFRSLGRHDLVDATSRIRQRTREPGEALQRFVDMLEAYSFRGEQRESGFGTAPVAEAKIPGDVAPRSGPAGRPMSCPQCQQVIPVGVRYCAYCGMVIAGAAGPQTFITRSGQRLETMRDIGRVLNRDPHTRAEAMYHLYNGHFETWFRSLGRHDLVDAVERLRQHTRDPARFLDQFLLLVAASPAPGEVDRPLGEQVREIIAPAELTTDTDLRRAIVYLLIGVLIGGALFVGVLVLSALLGRC